MDVGSATYVILDLETTGLDAADHRVVEVGAIKLSAGKETGRYESLVNPQRDVDPGAREQHGITDAELAGAPKFKEIAEDFRRFLGGSVLVAQNASFDLGFLNAEFTRCGMTKLAQPAVDTIPLAHRALPGLPSYSLDSLSSVLKIENRSRHRSIGDCEATVKVFLECLKILREKRKVQTVADLVTLGAPRR